MAYITRAELKLYLGIADWDEFTAAVTDELTLTRVTNLRDHLQTADPVQLTTTGTLPAPLALLTTYYVILGTGQDVLMATTPANAVAGTDVNLTDVGTGTHTITRMVSEDAPLDDAIEAAQAYIEAQTHRYFEAQTLTRYYDRSALDDDTSTLLHLDEDLLTVTMLANGDGAGESTYTSTFAADTLTLATASVYAALETATPVQVFSTANDPPAPLVQGTTYFAILTTSPVIQLATTPALAIAGTAITLTDDGTGTHTIICHGTPIEHQDFWLMPRNMGPPYYQIQLKANTGIYWQWDVDHLASVTGTWGYTAAAPDDIKQAALVLAAYFYRQKDAQIFDTTAIPEAGVITIPQGIPATVTKVIDKYRKMI